MKNLKKIIFASVIALGFSAVSVTAVSAKSAANSFPSIASSSSGFGSGG